MSHDDSTASPEADGLPLFAEEDSSALSVRQVFGEAYAQDGALIIPVAMVAGTRGRALADGRGRLSDGRHRPFDAPREHENPEASGGEARPTEADIDQPAGPEGRPLPGEAPGSLRCSGSHPWHHPHPHGGHARGRGRAGAGGLATYARPLGVYVVKDGTVSWRPALDLNRAIIGGQIAGALIGTALAVTWPLAALLRRRR